MKKINRLALFLFISAFVILLNYCVAYAEDSISMFKKVADEADQIRYQYTERQNYLQEKQYLKDAADTIDLYNEELINNSAEQINVNETILEVSQKQEENERWFEQHKKLIEYRAPQLNTMNEYSERMDYLERQIAACDKLISEREDLIQEYNKQIDALMKQIGYVDELSSGASLHEKQEAVLKALEYVEYAADRLDEANSLKNKLLMGNTLSAADNVQDEGALYAQIEAIESEAEYINSQLENYYPLQQDLYAIQDRVRSVSDLEEWKEELYRWQEGLKKDNSELKDAIKTIEAEKIRIEKYLSYERYGKYLSTGMEYYSWKRDDGFSGHQLYMPVAYFQEHGYSEYGVSFGLVNTSADYGADDGLNGITDVSLYYGLRNVYERCEIKYTVNIDLPVGESKIGDIPLSDDLVPVTRLNEGGNIRPGLELLYRVGDENVWSAAIGYTFKGNYDYSKSNPGLFVSPGDALDGELSWTHAEKDYQLRLGVEPSFYTKTGGDDLSYREGIKMLYKVMYNRKLGEHSDLMGYYWLRRRFADKYDYPAGYKGNDSTVHYYGLEYKYAPNERHAWFARSNNMSSTGQYYDPVSGDSSNDRRKHVVGVGYEFNMNTGGKIGVGVNNFWMKDKNPDKKYDGFEVLFLFSKSL